MNVVWLRKVVADQGMTIVDFRFSEIKRFAGATEPVALTISGQAP